MSATAGDGGSRCSCGAMWFRLVASVECDEPGQVALDDRGNVTSFAGACVCASCGAPWGATPRQRLRLLSVPDDPDDDRQRHPTSVIYAPFSDDQVRALNAWQANGRLHPFTCANDMHAPGARSGPFIGRFGQQRVLVATPAGWVCSDPNCGYVQDWAHAAMTT